MPEKFEPGQFESFESLPEEEKENFKKVDDGFAKKEALDLEEAQERADKMQEKIASGEAKDHNEADEILDQEKILSSLSENQRNELKEILKSKRISGLWNVNNLYWVPKELHLKIAEIWINQGDGSFVKEFIDWFSCDKEDVMQLIANYNIKREKEERTARYDLVKNTELHNQLIDCDNEIQEKLNAMKIKDIPKKDGYRHEFTDIKQLIKELETSMNNPYSEGNLDVVMSVIIRKRTKAVFLTAASAIPLGWVFKEALKQAAPNFVKDIKFFSLMIKRAFLKETPRGKYLDFMDNKERERLYYKTFEEETKKLGEIIKKYDLDGEDMAVIDEESSTGATLFIAKEMFEKLNQPKDNVFCWVVEEAYGLNRIDTIKPKKKVFSEELDKLILVSQKSEDTKLLIDILKLEGKKLGILYKAFVNKEYKKGNEKYKRDAFRDAGVIDEEK